MMGTFNRVQHTNFALARDAFEFGVSARHLDHVAAQAPCLGDHLFCGVQVFPRQLVHRRGGDVLCPRMNRGQNPERPHVPKDLAFGHVSRAHECLDASLQQGVHIHAHC